MTVVSVKPTTLKRTKQRSDLNSIIGESTLRNLGMFSPESATENEPIERVISMCNLWLEKTEENDWNKAQRKTWKNSLPGRLNEVRNRERRGLPVYRWIVEIMTASHDPQSSVDCYETIFWICQIVSNIAMKEAHFDRCRAPYVSTWHSRHWWDDWLVYQGADGLVCIHTVCFKDVEPESRMNKSLIKTVILK